MGSLKPQGWEVKVFRKVSKAKNTRQVQVPALASVCPPVQWEHRAMLPRFFLLEQCRLRLARPWIQNAWPQNQIYWRVHSGVTPGLIRAVSYILASLLPLLGLLPPRSRCVGGPCSPLGLGAQGRWRECGGGLGGVELGCIQVRGPQVWPRWPPSLEMRRNSWDGATSHQLSHGGHLCPQ